MAHRVVLASGNSGKLRELRAVLQPLGLELVAQSTFGLETPPEIGATFRENALIKARHAAEATGLPALSDDSGLEVDALGGRPGVYSARYAGEGASDRQNLLKMLDELRGVPAEERGARYRCVIAFVRSGRDPEPIVAEGAWEGCIIEQPRGNGGFGYDPIFLPTGSLVTSAELAPERKNDVSHRGQALRQLVRALREAMACW